MNINLTTNPNPYLNPTQAASSPAPSTNTVSAEGTLFSTSDSAEFSAEATQLAAGEGGLGSDFPSDPGGRP